MLGKVHSIDELLYGPILEYYNGDVCSTNYAMNYSA